MPNFETTKWIFKFSVEMEEMYFDEENYLFQWATYQDTDGLIPAATVACGVMINDYESVDIIEYDDTFDSTS